MRFFAGYLAYPTTTATLYIPLLDGWRSWRRRRCHLYTKEGGECRHAHSRGEGEKKGEDEARKRGGTCLYLFRVIASRARVDQGPGQLPTSKYECDKKKLDNSLENCSFLSLVAVKVSKFHSHLAILLPSCTFSFKKNKGKFSSNNFTRILKTHRIEKFIIIRIKRFIWKEKE